MKVHTVLFAMLLLLSCKENVSVEKVNPVEETPDEMSIYQLPAVWNTQEDQKIEFRDLKGETLVMVMIYTACRTACPRLVADMRNIASSVGPENQVGIKYVLVSIDPKNDTPEKLKIFAKENGMDGPQWLFLQGTEESVREFANVLAVKYKQISPIDFSHSNIISVFDKKGVMQFQKEGLGLENQDVINKILENI